MQKLILFLAFLLIAYSSFGQTKQEQIHELVKEGTRLHDGRLYQKALKKYQEALAIDKKSTLANYEIAMTYSEMGEHDTAIKHANKVIKQKKDHMVAAYTVKGNSFDVQGKTKKSIKLFKKALSETKGHYLLHYNLGINYFKQGDILDASTQMIEAIKKNPSHASSHLYLALSQKRLNNVIPSILSNMYFLLLEPATERAGNAYDLLENSLDGNVTEDKNNPNNSILMLNGNEDNPYQSVEMMIGLMATAKTMDEAKSSSEEELFIENLRSLLNTLVNLEIAEKSIFTDFYTPFYADLLESDHFDTFCYYIMHGSNQPSADWCDNHPEELKALFKWLNK